MVTIVSGLRSAGPVDWFKVGRRRKR